MLLHIHLVTGHAREVDVEDAVTAAAGHFGPAGHTPEQQQLQSLNENICSMTIKLQRHCSS